MTPPAHDDPPPPGLALCVRLTVTVAEPVVLGDTGAGLRRMIPITGGTLHGPRLHGRVLPGGADWQVVRDTEGLTALEARYVVELADGTRVGVTNRALRHATPEVSARLTRGEVVDPAQVYFRCAPVFEVADGPWRWLRERLFVGDGVRRPDRVEMRFYEVT